MPTTPSRSTSAQAVRPPKPAALAEGAPDATAPHHEPSQTIPPANKAWDDFFNAPGIDLNRHPQPPPDRTPT